MAKYGHDPYKNQGQRPSGSKDNYRSKYYKLTKGRIAVHGAHMQMVLMWTAKLNTTNIHALLKNHAG